MNLRGREKGREGEVLEELQYIYCLCQELVFTHASWEPLEGKRSQASCIRETEREKSSHLSSHVLTLASATFWLGQCQSNCRLKQDALSEQSIRLCQRERDRDETRAEGGAHMRLNQPFENIAANNTFIHTRHVSLYSHKHRASLGQWSKLVL